MAALKRPRDHLVVVVSVDFRVVVVSPIGDTTVPVEEDPLDLVTTPLTLEVRSLVVSVDVTGIGATGVVVVWVVVELVDEDCARTAPVIKVTATVAASNVLIT
jgi:hypothetical protein